MSNIDINEITVIGDLTDIKLTKNAVNAAYFDTVLHVKRVSKTKVTNDEFIVHIPAGVYERSDKSSNHVKIVGEIRTFTVYENDRRHLKIIIYANSVEPTKDDDMCEVVLIGTICKKNDIRMTPYGKKIRDFTIANNYSEKRAAYIPAICWDAVAESFETLPVGTYISTSGILHSRVYTKKEVHGNDEVVIQKRAYEYSVNSYFVFDRSKSNV